MNVVNQSSRSPELSPELLLAIFAHLGSPKPARTDEDDDVFNPTERNCTLLSAALVCKAWAGPAIESLYSDLEISWRPNSGMTAAAKLAADPALRLRVRRLRAESGSGDSAEDFWAFLSSLYSLRSLQVSGFAPPKSPELLEKLKPIFAKLKVAMLDVGFKWDPSIAGDFAVALLRDVRALHLHITGTESARPALSSKVFENLTHIYVSWEWTEEGPQRGDSAILHHINPASLVALKLVDPSNKNLEVLGSLGEMPNLRSLSVTSISQEESNKEPPDFPPSLLAILPNTHLTHVTIPDWPADEFLEALPPTVLSIRMVDTQSFAQYNNDNAESYYEAWISWKPQFLPALEVLDLDAWYFFLIGEEDSEDEDEDGEEAGARQEFLATMKGQGVRLCDGRTGRSGPLPGEWMP